MMPLLLGVSVGKEEVAESEEMRALVEPPVVQVVKPVGWFDGLDRQWHDEVVE